MKRNWSYFPKYYDKLCTPRQLRSLWQVIKMFVWSVNVYFLFPHFPLAFRNGQHTFFFSISWLNNYQVSNVRFFLRLFLISEISPFLFFSIDDFHILSKGLFPSSHIYFFSSTFMAAVRLFCVRNRRLLRHVISSHLYRLTSLPYPFSMIYPRSAVFSRKPVGSWHISCDGTCRFISFLSPILYSTLWRLVVFCFWSCSIMLAD